MDLPRLGLGTYKLTDREECVEAVTTAVDAGYRHIDTAQMYDNEAYVGEGIAEAGVDREDLFVATKLDPSNLSREDAVETARASVDDLGLDYVDLLYVHWPQNTYDPDETLPALDELVDDGLVENVGLSNFRTDQLDEARERLDAPLFAHQVEMHPLLPQEELVSYAREHDHWLVAYSPVARGKVFDLPEIREVAEKHDATPAQVSLAWLLAKDNVAAIPKSATPDHIRENYGALDVDLDDEDVAKIDGIGDEERIVDPSDAPWNRV